MAAVFTERSRRVWAATEARAIGHGGIALVERATGISRSTIQRGIRDLQSGETLAPERTRKAGAGRKRATATDETLLAALSHYFVLGRAGSNPRPRFETRPDR